MSTKNATAVAVFRTQTFSTNAAEASAAAPKTTGWDPYEVWRTRVLIPRLQEKTAGELADAPAKTLLFRSI